MSYAQIDLQKSNASEVSIDIPTLQHPQTEKGERKQQSEFKTKEIIQLEDEIKKLQQLAKTSEEDAKPVHHGRRLRKVTRLVRLSKKLHQSKTCEGKRLHDVSTLVRQSKCQLRSDNSDGKMCRDEVIKLLRKRSGLLPMSKNVEKSGERLYKVIELVRQKIRQQRLETSEGKRLPRVIELVRLRQKEHHIIPSQNKDEGEELDYYDCKHEDPDLHDECLICWVTKFIGALIEGKSECMRAMLDKEYTAKVNGLASSLAYDVYLPDVLFIAIINGDIETSLFEKLIELIPKEKLTYYDLHCEDQSQSFLHIAITVRNVTAVKALVKRNRDLVRIKGGADLLPVHCALMMGDKEIAYFLHIATDLKEQFETTYGDFIVTVALYQGWYEFASYVLRRVVEELKRIPWDDHPADPLVTLVEDPRVFRSGTPINIFKAFLYSCIKVKPKDVVERFKRKEIAKAEEDLNPTEMGKTYKVLRGLQEFLCNVSNKIWGKLAWPIEDIRQEKIKHELSADIVRQVCGIIKETKIEKSCLTEVFLEAARNGIVEMVKTILDHFPDAISDLKNDKRESIFHLAATNRRVKVFRVALQHWFCDEDFESDEGTVLYYLARTYLPKTITDISRGVVFGMQSELRWFKEVEELMPIQRYGYSNDDQPKPIDLFNKNHEDMIEYENQWMMAMANSCIVGGSLIFTVVYAAAITVPGGNNDSDPDEGLPVFLGRDSFQIFSIANRLSLTFSLTSVLIFLSIFTSRHSLHDYIYSLPNRIIFGLVFLFLSFTALMVNFSAIAYLVSDRDTNLIVTGSLASIPLVFFGYLQLPSFVNMIKTTYFHRCFKKYVKDEDKRNELQILWDDIRD